MASAVTSDLSTRGSLVKLNPREMVKRTFFRKPRRLNATLDHTSCLYLISKSSKSKQGTSLVYTALEANDSCRLLSGASVSRFLKGSEVINQVIRDPCTIYMRILYVTLAGGALKFRAVDIINFHKLTWERYTRLYGFGKIYEHSYWGERARLHATTLYSPCGRQLGIRSRVWELAK